MPTEGTLLGDTVRVHGHMSERPEFEKALSFALPIGPCSWWQAIRMVIP